MVMPCLEASDKRNPHPGVCNLGPVVFNIFIGATEEGTWCLLVRFANDIGRGDAADMAVCAPRKLETTVHHLYSDEPRKVKCGMRSFHMENEEISAEAPQEACQAAAPVMAQGSLHRTLQKVRPKTPCFKHLSKKLEEKISFLELECL